jgi:hypothetical protein
VYNNLSGVCFCNFTFILSAGKDIKAVVIDDRIAEIFRIYAEFDAKNGLISSIIIYVPASCPTFISSTLSMVISMPRHNFANPY